MTDAFRRRLFDRIAGADRDEGPRSRLRRWRNAVVTSVGLVAVVSVAISILDDHAPVLPLIVLYLLAVVPVAVLWGLGFAAAVSVASVLLFAYVFVPPGGHVPLTKSDTWYSIFVFVFTAVVVSELTARSQRAARTSARLAEEQGALRRVATLVARQTTTRQELDALICREVAAMLSADLAVMRSFRDDGTTRLMGRWSRAGRFDDSDPPAVHEVIDVIAHTNRPAQVGSASELAGFAASALSAVGAPIVVEAKLWGAVVVVAESTALPRNTSERLADFTALVAIAIANAMNRAELDASRRRLVMAADQARRQIERDLHDGTQQQLVALAIELQGIQEGVPEELLALRADLGRVARGLVDTLDEIREIARGIHPAILAQGGLVPALKTLARRSAIPVELEVSVAGRLADQVEVAAYYVVAESLTNAVKHSEAKLIRVSGDVHAGTLRIRVEDDGRGGASSERGSGLVGITDRVEALGGTLSVRSPAGAGTTVDLELPTLARATSL
jgi:signal transduction histidine kinase